MRSFGRQSAPVLKSRREIALMRDAGGVVADVLAMARETARPGMTTGELNAAAEELIAKAGGTALFKGVKNPQAKIPFPGALCTSVNDEVVHGVPGDRKLAEGDILSVDCGVRLRGYCGDAAVTVPIGAVSPDVQRLLDVTRESLNVAIREMRPGRVWSEIAREIQSVVESAGFSVVRDFVGHGIGQEMHEEPKVPNFVDRRKGGAEPELRNGLTLAVEPMVNMGRPDVQLGDKLGWTVVTKDGSLSAHFEHTIAVVGDGSEVLTERR